MKKHKRKQKIIAVILLVLFVIAFVLSVVSAIYYDSEASRGMADVSILIIILVSWVLMASRMPTPNNE